MCIEVCSRMIDIYGVMMNARRKEDIPALIRKSIDNITGTGCSLDLREINQIRKMYGLGPVRLVEEEELAVLLG